MGLGRAQLLSHCQALSAGEEEEEEFVLCAVHRRCVPSRCGEAPAPAFQVLQTPSYLGSTKAGATTCSLLLLL